MPETATPPPAPPASLDEPISHEAFMEGLTAVLSKSQQAHADKTPPPPPASPTATAPPTAAPGAPPTPPAGEPAEPPPASATPTPKAPVPELPSRSPKAADWKAVNEERARLRERVSQLEKRVEPEEVERIRGERDSYQKLLREIAAERDPELIGPIMQKEQLAIDLAKAALPADLQEEGLALLRAPDEKRLDEILENLSTIKRERFTKAILAYEEAQNERKSLGQRSQEVITRRQQEQQQRAQQISKEFEVELSDWTSEEKGVAMLRPKEGDAEHNERAKNIMESARVLFSGHKLTPREFARAAIRATIAPFLEQQNAALLAERDQLQAEITKMKGGAPGLPSSGAGSTTSGTPQEWNPDSGETMVQWLMRNAKSQGIIE